MRRQQAIEGRTGRGEGGFTLIELLVVTLILSLLVAIALPAFFTQREKARDAEAKSQVRTAASAVETFATDNNGSYDGATRIDLGEIEKALRDVGPRLSVPRTTEREYTVQVRSETGISFQLLREADGSTTTFCDRPGHGGCPSDGTW